MEPNPSTSVPRETGTPKSPLRKLSSNPNKIPILLAGPTGAGKSQFAVELAQRVGGEIVNADAFQIYRGLARLTSQPDARQQSEVPHHLYGWADPAEAFSVASYLEHVVPCVDEIFRRGRVPLVTGGTGLYFRAFLQGLDPAPPASEELRHQLALLSREDLLQELRDKDPKALETLDLNNPRRIQRALEIVIQTGRPLAEFRKAWLGPSRPHVGFLLSRPKEELDERIETNVHHMLKEGAIEEVHSISEPGPTASKALGFREIRDFDFDLADPQALATEIILSTRRYARRQLTWFRRQTTFSPVDLSEPESLPRVIERIRNLQP